jgi:hypothetical protein
MVALLCGIIGGDVQHAKKLGLVAFLFFLVKGLLWLAIPALIYTWGC